MDGMIFDDNYYFDKILDNSKKIKGPLLRPIADKIEKLSIIAMLSSNEYLISDDIIIFNRKGKEYKLSLSEIKKELPDIAQAIIANGKVSIEEAKAAVSAKEKELIKVNEVLIHQSDKFKRDAETDALTGLFNRRKFDEDCKAVNPKDSIILMADINYLKTTNDTIGHEVGDLLIKSVADELYAAFPNKAYRIGGDEFVLLLNKISEIDLKDKIEEIKDNLNNNPSLPKNAISAGYCIWSPENNDIKAMLNIAERRMYKEKQLIKNEDNKKIDAARITEDLSSDMVYNIHTFSLNNRSYVCIVAPLYLDPDVSRPEIFAFVKNDLGTSGGYVSEKNSSIIKFDFDGENFLLQARIIENKFTTTIMTSENTLRAGLNIENMQVKSKTTENIFKTKGHAVSIKDNIVFHAIPLSNSNNENGICMSAICIEDGDTRAVIKNKANKETFYKNINILAHWNNGEYEMEAI